MVNRRQFFSRLLQSEPGVRRSDDERIARNRDLETRVQRDLLPSDFALTERESSFIASRVRFFLEGASDATLFSPHIVDRLNQLVTELIEPLRMASAEVSPMKEPKTLRKAAVQAVTTFLQTAAPSQVDSMMTRFAADDLSRLEEALAAEIADWAEAIPDEELLKYDAVSIQDPALRHLRTSCR